VDQRTNGRRWVLLGTFAFPSGVRTVRFVRQTSSPGLIAADAIKLEPVRPLATDGLSASAGWALTSRQLSATADGGKTWRPIEPAGVPSTALRAVDLDDPAHGWAVALDPGSAGLQLLWTTDGGATWATGALPAPADLDAGGSVTA